MLGGDCGEVLHSEINILKAAVEAVCGHTEKDDTTSNGRTGWKWLGVCAVHAGGDGTNEPRG